MFCGLWRMQVINRRVVEPNRKLIDLQKIYRNKHLQKVRGLGLGVMLLGRGAGIACSTLLASDLCGL